MARATARGGNRRYNGCMASYIEWIRQRVGTRKIFLVFSSVVLWEANGRSGPPRVLLQRRTDFDVWGLPGGVLELDEDIEQCARRELREETGLTAGPLRLVGVYTDPRYDVVYPNGDQVQQFTICFSGSVSGGEMAVDGTETRAQRFYAWPLPADLPLLPWYRAMLADVAAGGPPAFLPPAANGATGDQIASVRPFCGQERLIAVGAAALVLRADGRILMVRRRDNGDWFFPAGYSNLGENVAQTAVREVKEETNLDIWPERIAGIFSSARFHQTFPNGDQVKNVGVLFQARLLGGTPRPDPAEVADLAWMTPDEVLAVTPAPYAPYAAGGIRHAHDGYFLL